MGIFEGANNFIITGGNFTTVSSPTTNANPQNDIVTLLYCHSATAGLLDAKERFDAPKCDQGTRNTMIRAMKMFVQEGDAASLPGLYWLHGPAGVGKSALAQSVSLQLQSEGDHAASFFFSRTSPGRNNGNQLIVTLAYQLAVNFPGLQPFMSKVIKTNPGIIDASNAVQMKGLIVDPINKWQRKYNWSIRRWIDRMMNTKRPRLILVDGLDECNDPNVQTDIIHCIASAVSQLPTPLRFVVVSRPESHILAAFELEGLDGVTVTKKNLGEDEDAAEQITTFLSKEFARIRRTHPIRDFLPPQWPRPDQIGQLVTKSSNGFIYPTTVIRYIKMSYNRPDECLDRILGLSELPTSDKPYEPLDLLYRHIFESVPEVNKRSIHNIFHFLVVPSPWDGVTRSATTIEKHFDYPRGQVQHVLHDLLSLVEHTPDGSTNVLHASLPDFLLDESRSGPLFIDVGDAHATVAACFLMVIRQEKYTFLSHHFDSLLDHLQKANISNGLLNDRIFQTDLLKEYCKLSIVDIQVEVFRRRGRFATKTLYLYSRDMQNVGLITAYLLVLVKLSGPQIYIRNQIADIKDFTFSQYPALDNQTTRPEIIICMTPLFCQWKSLYPEAIRRAFECKVDSSRNELREAVLEIYFFMMASLHQKLIAIPATSDIRIPHPETGRTEQGPHYWANIVYPNVTLE